jgi:hypothetical protein
MKIYITNIKIHSISNIGSLNIGRTIISHNQATESQIAQNGVPPAQPAPVPAIPPVLVQPVQPIT